MFNGDVNRNGNKSEMDINEIFNSTKSFKDYSKIVKSNKFMGYRYYLSKELICAYITINSKLNINEHCPRCTKGILTSLYIEGNRQALKCMECGENIIDISMIKGGVFEK